MSVIKKKKKYTFNEFNIILKKKTKQWLYHEQLETMNKWVTENRWLEERQRQGQGAMKLFFICRKKNPLLIT